MSTLNRDTASVDSVMEAAAGDLSDRLRVAMHCYSTIMKHRQRFIFGPTHISKWGDIYNW